jgi:uncharacterized protein
MGVNNSSKAQANKLAQESSLYLRQHAYNPVEWHPWGDEALKKAKLENKPLLISIGYSACHWCHVMEHESFSNREVADYMNAHFVNIKIDREERPDLDQLYMEAVQLLHGHGGWPLNCFALPDGRPFWGATYFRKDQWMQVMQQISRLFETEPETLKEQASRLSEGINQMNFSFEPAGESNFSSLNPDKIFDKLTTSFDTTYGGFQGAPKFPMPSVYRFLLHYYFTNKKNEALDHVKLTLKSMAAGGIYDQVGGGFARYSTDKFWKVPHFEKMLYDNAQLITLYCETYMLSGEEVILDTAIETIEFLEREMGSPATGFSAAIDADSPEGEGAFYTFTPDELHELLKEDAPLLLNYWRAETDGVWEHGRSILMAPADKASFCEKNDISAKRLSAKLHDARKKLLAHRNTRPAPAIDPKILTSWNALLASAYVSLFRATAQKSYLTSAKKLIGYILENLCKDEHILLHQLPDQQRSINGFLDDYSAVIQALTTLYSASQEEQWLRKAVVFSDSAITQFYNEQSGLFFYTGSLNEKSFARKQEIHDNVIPSSNSMMMENLYVLGLITTNSRFTEIATRAVQGMTENLLKHPSAFSNWARLSLMFKYPCYTIAISGRDRESMISKLRHTFLPQAVLVIKSPVSPRAATGETCASEEILIQLCTGSECLPPFRSLDDALDFLR